MRRLAKCEKHYRPAPEKSQTGVVIRRPVDQSPSAKVFRDEQGFFKNDIMLLKEASNTNDKALFEALASRLQVVQERDNGFNVKEAFAHWKPSVIQTASEEQAWIAYTKQFMPDVYVQLYGSDETEKPAELAQPEEVKSE